MKVKIYHFLVNRVPEIQKRYHNLRKQKKGICGRIYAWISLLWMNLVSIFFRKKYDDAFFYPDKKKKMSMDSSESFESVRETPKELAERLMQYDIISFDVFDTIIFRPFSLPTDLFYIVGEKLDYLGFEQIRRKAEQNVREKAKLRTGSYEVTLEQIYEEIENVSGIPANKGMQIEIDSEMKYCFGNPYMLEVFKYLEGCNSKIICNSDMYLPEKVIRQMVEKCGYKGISQYFVSCEQGALKGNGSLYHKIKDTYGTDKKYVHIGDNYDADVEWAKKSGFEAVYYRNINVAGLPYRAEDLSVILGSMYRGIVNAHIHNGLRTYSLGYEIGYIYGGLFVLGYCRWIHEYVTTHKIDKVLFLSRDGDLLSQVYNILYPEEKNSGRSEYVYWSRLAATKMAAGYYKRDYFRRFIDHKVNQGYTLRHVFESMEIVDMLAQMCQETSLSADAILTEYNCDIVKEYLQKNWSLVLTHYEEQLAAGKLYYEDVLQGCKRVLAVDVGWAGSGAITLNYIVNHIWNLECEVIGALAGTNTIYDDENNMSVSQLESGKLISYMYSQSHNRDIWRWHNAAKGHNVGLELICSSIQGSLKGFYYDTAGEVKKYKISLKKPDVDVQKIQEIQQGVLDFVNQANELALAGRYISGNDAYQVLRIFLNNDKSMQQLMNEFEMGI